MAAVLRKQVKALKRLLCLFLCLCLLMTTVSSVITAYADDDPIDSGTVDAEDLAYEEIVGDDAAETEAFYAEQTTVYDLENEEDVPDQPEQSPPPPDSDAGETDAEIYGDALFDYENAQQLQGEYVIDEIIVKFKEPWQVPGKEKQLQKEINKVKKIGIVDALGVYVIKVDEFRRDSNSVLNRFKNNKYVEYVEPNYTFKTEVVPNDPNYKTQQVLVLTVLNAQRGWDILAGTSVPVIAVVDSGVASHADLPPLLPGYSAVADLSPNNDKLNHGTGVAGTIGMLGNNGIGGVGINWNASLLPVKVDDANGTLTTANMAKGIVWAADNGSRIINLSCGSSSDSVTLKNAIDYAYDKGCVIIAGTGNDGKNSLLYPARYSNVLAVGATTNASSRVAFANYGEGINVVAVGGYYTTGASGGYTSQAGTSFATPQVSALASLVWAVNPDLSNDEIYRLIEQGAKTLGGGFNDETGYGLIDIEKTLELASETVAPTTPLLPPETPQEIFTPPLIKLAGFTEMTLAYGQAYTEPGYLATDCKNVDITSDVIVTNAVDIWTPGIYTVTYDAADAAGLSARAVRTVTVNPEPVEMIPAEAPKITVNGSNPIVLHLTSGTPYTEQRARAVDSDGTDISHLVRISGTINRNTAGTYTLTYSITSPKSGLTSTAARNVRIVAPTEKKEPRVKYGLSGQAKQGGIVSHTGIVCNEAGFIDLTVATIDKNMTISVKLVDVATKKALLVDTFTTAGTKQYNILQGKYELVVGVMKANGNSKYAIDLLMPEATLVTFEEEEVPLGHWPIPYIAPIGSNPIILHIGGTPYTEQGARAVDFNGEDISNRVEVIGAPDTNVAGTYPITYKVVNDWGFEAETIRDVRILDPNDKTTILDEEIPLANADTITGAQDPEIMIHVVVSGDNLTRIALQYYGDGTRWREIYTLNREIIGNNPNLIYPGQKLKIKLE